MGSALVLKCIENVYKIKKQIAFYQVTLNIYAQLLNLFMEYQFSIDTAKAVQNINEN